MPELWDLDLAAIEYAFCDDETKGRLRESFLAWGAGVPELFGRVAAVALSAQGSNDVTAIESSSSIALRTGSYVTSVGIPPSPRSAWTVPALGERLAASASSWSTVSGCTRAARPDGASHPRRDAVHDLAMTRGAARTSQEPEVIVVPAVASPHFASRMRRTRSHG